MQKLKFDVYIGFGFFQGQSPEVKAVIIPKFHLPHGQCQLDGKSSAGGDECFNNLHNVGTYFSDWIDLIGDDSKIIATIHLNILSHKKVFEGREIINVIDKISQIKHYEKIRNFLDIL